MSKLSDEEIKELMEMFICEQGLYNSFKMFMLTRGYDPEDFEFS